MSTVQQRGQDRLFTMVIENGMIQSARFAKALHVTKKQLAVATGLGEDALRKKSREHAVRTQQRLRDVMEILNRVQPWFGSIEQAYAWYRSEPLSSFGGRTPEDLVKADQAEAVKRYLSRVAVGGHA